MDKKQQLLENLPQFCGTEEYMRYSLLGVKLLLTDGVVYLAATAGAYWLIDLIASHQIKRAVKEQEFQVWKLKKNTNETWTATCEDGNENELCKQEIPFSDFPLDEITLYNADGVVMLPSEY